jgi:predicted Zn-dependent protease
VITVGRVAVAVVAVVVVAWLGIMERDTRLQANSLKLIGAGHPVRADKELRRARLLNPDTAPDLRRSLAYFTEGDTQLTRTTLESVLRREPSNIQAWATLLALSRTRDPATAARALAAIKRLDPLGAPQR